jgi:hypothetical protein
VTNENFHNFYSNYGSKTFWKQENAEYMWIQEHGDVSRMKHQEQLKLFLKSQCGLFYTVMMHYNSHITNLKYLVSP